jgi:hypothetical protein
MLLPLNLHTRVSLKKLPIIFYYFKIKKGREGSSLGPGLPGQVHGRLLGKDANIRLAKHYTDHSLDYLKAIYDKEGLRILS